MKTFSLALAAMLAASAAAALHAQTTEERPLPRLVKKDSRYGLFVDDAPFLMLGAQAHNSSAWPEMITQVWPAPWNCWCTGSRRVLKRIRDLCLEEGAYEDGVFKMRRIWNGDETDWVLNFGAGPVVLRVSVGTY